MKLTDDDVDRLLDQDASAWRTRTGTEAAVDPGQIATAEQNSFVAPPFIRLLGVAFILMVAATALTVWSAPFFAPTATPSGSLIARATPSLSPSEAATSATPSTATATATSHASLQASASPLQPEEINYGDQVIGLGRVISAPGTQPYLCADVLSTGFDIPACGMSLLVDVLGFDPRSVEGTDHSGIWLTTKVELRGTWEPDGLHVNSVTVIEPGGDFPLVPCAAPSGGWPGTVGDIYSERADLDQYLVDHNDRFFGPWVASVDGSPPAAGDGILVVGTVDDPTLAGTDLSAQYHSSLCVTKVAYSNAALADVRQAIGPALSRFVVDIDSRDRLIVKPLMLTQAFVEQMAAYQAYCIVEPLIRLDDT